MVQRGAVCASAKKNWFSVLRFSKTRSSAARRRTFQKPSASTIHLLQQRTGAQYIRPTPSRVGPMRVAAGFSPRHTAHPARLYRVLSDNVTVAARLLRLRW